jgi:predicted  nucleic acid-binding Zn-ribbon protein
VNPISEVLESLTELQKIDCQIASLRKFSNPQPDPIQPGEKELVDFRARVVSKIPQPYVLLYQKLLQSRKGVAISEVRGGSCTGCHMVLPPQFVSQLTRSPVVVHCPTCHRILARNLTASEALAL